MRILRVCTESLHRKRSSARVVGEEGYSVGTVGPRSHPCRAARPARGRLDADGSGRGADYPAPPHRLAQEGVYPRRVEKIRVVLDYLSTHTAASCEGLLRKVARELARRIQFVYTPVHGSWPNMAEIGLWVLVRPCLKLRLPDVESLCEEVWT